MAARRTPRSIVNRLSPPLRRRAACFVAALLFLMVAPGWAFTPVTLADTGPYYGFASGRLPTGGYLLAWQDVRRSTSALRVQRFTAAGRPLGPTKDLDLGDSGGIGVTFVAVNDSGAWGVFWEEGSGADQIGVGAAFFDAQDKLLARVSYPDPIPDPGGLIISYHPLALALSGGGFYVATEVGTQDDPVNDPLRPTRSDVYVMKLDRAGRKVGEAVRVNSTTSGFHRLTGLGGSRDHVVVSWDAVPVAPEPPAVRARFLDGNLQPTGLEVNVAELDESVGLPNSRLAVAAGGRAVIAWRGKEVGPGGGPVQIGVRIRAFGPNGEPRGVEHAADPGTPGDHYLADLGLTTEGTVWVSWTTPGKLAPSGDVFETVLSLRPFDLAAQPTGNEQDLATTVGTGPFLTGGRGGALVTWRETSSSPSVEGFVVGPAGGMSGPPSPPFAIESAEVPGFRAWVRISPPSVAPLWGTPVTSCLAQSLCAAGPLPSRADVIVRVIGPKPNGFLWPQIVRFTTDPVEVWVQQKATGEIRYYALPEGSPESETLTGRFDRFGFRP
jgi:hypothetical protein